MPELGWRQLAARDQPNSVDGALEMNRIPNTTLSRSLFVFAQLKNPRRNRVPVVGSGLRRACGITSVARGRRQANSFRCLGRAWHGVYLQILLGMFCLAPSAHAEPFLLDVIDQLGQPLSARVRLRDQAGVDHLPPSGLSVPLGKDQWFVTPGRSRLDIPSGELDLRVEHGLEYHPVKQQVVCRAGQETRHSVRLQRWIDMSQLGYLCGENHLHVPIAELGPQLVAEGLDFGTSLAWWNARRLDVPADGGPIRGLRYAGVIVPTSVYDYEIEHDWGAVYVLGQPTPLAIDNDSDLPNLPVVRRSHDLGALVCYQGGWSREILLDSLLGYVDVVNVCNNNFLRHAYQPRSRYSNLLQVPGFPSYGNNAAEMLRMNTETYYRLLNCGLRLAAGAGSATGPKQSPVGYNRSYVRVDHDATLPEFLAAWRKGKNFVTNGPMLLLKANGRYQPGDTVERSAPGDTLSIEVTATFPHPLSKLEIVVNGRVVHQDSKVKSGVATTIPIRIEASAWLAARCTAEDQLLSDAEMAAYDWGSEQMPRKPTRLRFAHTSPIYIRLDGKPPRVEQSIREAHQMLDALTEFAEEKAVGESRLEIRRAIAEARQELSE